MTAWKEAWFCLVFVHSYAIGLSVIVITGVIIVAGRQRHIVLEQLTNTDATTYGFNLNTTRHYDALHSTLHCCGLFTVDEFLKSKCNENSSLRLSCSASLIYDDSHNRTLPFSCCTTDVHQCSYSFLDHSTNTSTWYMDSCHSRLQADWPIIERLSFGLLIVLLFMMPVDIILIWCRRIHEERAAPFNPPTVVPSNETFELQQINLAMTPSIFSGDIPSMGPSPSTLSNGFLLQSGLKRPESREVFC